MDRAIMLEAKNIRKQFSGVTVLDQVDIHVRKGEVLGLIGGNGAGKSTLLKILNGIYPYGTYEGEIWIDGRQLKFMSPHDAQRKGIGFVPQETNVLDSLSVGENIFAGHLSSVNSSKWRVNMKKVNEAAGELFKQYHFEFDPAMKARLLSVGKKQLLMIARALSLQPKVLILDEPTTSLTVNEVENLIRIVEGLKKNGTSIVFVTHKMQEIFQLCDRTLILRDGRCIQTYEKSQFREEWIVRDMTGREIKNLYPERVNHIGEELLRVENLTVAHPEVKNRLSLDSISFTLRKGEVLGIAGLTGAGRSEVLNALYGRLPWEKGDIWLNGKKIKIRNERDAMKHGFALVTEDRKKDGMLFLSSIKRNLTINHLVHISAYGFLKPGQEYAVANRYYKLMKVKATGIEALIGTLSGGNQQKVVIGRALNNEPAILLLDEPTKGIDVGAKNEIYTIINQLVEQGLSVIMVSSDLPELLALSDRCIVLANGAVVEKIDKADATEERVMLSATRSAHFE
ncbi:sugar ABC transporter ATP-binding protein [Paenibacillus sp. GCM10027626]|uniref:sugar ABC transporter ATP-binding protein n=1 Tax=Paenibacillus sp. GCM10027626 TaxID=3273411 RepID=UPI0036433220